MLHVFEMDNIDASCEQRGMNARGGFTEGVEPFSENSKHLAAALHY